MNTIFESKAPDSNRPDLPIAIRTLIAGGFILEDAKRNPGYMLLYMYRPDEFGANHRYCFALADEYLKIPQVEAAKIAAQHHGAQLVIIGHSESDVPMVEWMRFINLFGGPVFSASPLEPNFSHHLTELGYNRLPDGLDGRPDDLFEAYVCIALEFILAGRVVRYGQDRRFEARPDGIALPDYNFSALYDAKAYSDGYNVTLDTIRQFRSYVEDFTRRYKAYLPRLNAFVVISGLFPHKDATLEKRSRDLLAECGVPLTFLTAESLSLIVSLLSEHPAARRSINWSRVFTDAIIRPERVETELEAVIRNGIIPKY